MRRFDYATPANVDEVITLLGTDEVPGVAGIKPAMALRPLGGVQPLAGGTDLLTLMKADVASPTVLVNVKGIDGLHRGIEETTRGLTLGALTTLSEIETSSLVRERFPALAEAAALAATPQLRNMATLGGNLLQRPRCWYFRSHLFHCWLKGGDECQARDGENQQHAVFDLGPCVAVHPSDPATALLALDAEVTLRGPRGDRTIAVDALLAAPEEERRQETTLRGDELLMAVHVRSLPAGSRSVYLKAMDRKVWAFALVGVAATARVENGKIVEARLALGGVANVPLRATRAEGMLHGNAPDDALFERAAAAALEGTKPLAHNGYKLPLAKSLVVRALREVTQPST